MVETIIERYFDEHPEKVEPADSSDPPAGSRKNSSPPFTSGEK
jgi:hypothetical protein